MHLPKGPSTMTPSPVRHVPRGRASAQGALMKQVGRQGKAVPAPGQFSGSMWPAIVGILAMAACVATCKEPPPEPEMPVSVPVSEARANPEPTVHPSLLLPGLDEEEGAVDTLAGVTNRPTPTDVFRDSPGAVGASRGSKSGQACVSPPCDKASGQRPSKPPVQIRHGAATGWSGAGSVDREGVARVF